MSAIDLTTAASVRAWIGVSSGTDDTIIGTAVTAFSLWALRYCGLGPADNSIPAASPLVAQVSFNETYDSDYRFTLFLRNSPIVSVQSLTVCGRTIPASTAWGQPGYVIDKANKALTLRGGGAGVATFTTVGLYGSCGFGGGPQSVNVQYTAGYNGIPPDLAQAANVGVGVWYQRKARRDQRSQTMNQGAGTVSFDGSPLPREVIDALLYYRRTAPVSCTNTAS